MATVLITGATGFLGGALAAHLLDESPDVTLILPARAENPTAARARVEASLRRFTTASPNDRLVVLPLDLAEPDIHAALPLGSVTHVVHFAVATGGEPRAFNVDATVALAAAALERGRLERFVYVGSAWSCGASKRGLVREDDPPDAAPLFAYLADKLTAEQRLCALAELPLQIVRPSLAMGHTKLGCEPSASLFWVLRLIDRMGGVPWDIDQKLDVVPVDWIASAMARLLFGDRRHAPRRVHLSAGDRSVSWRDIGDAFASHHRSTRRWSSEVMPAAAWLDRAAGIVGRGRAEVLTRCMRFLAGDACFDNTRVRSAGIPAPPPLGPLLETCLVRDGGRDITAQAADDL